MLCYLILKLDAGLPTHPRSGQRKGWRIHDAGFILSVVEDHVPDGLQEGGEVREVYISDDTDEATLDMLFDNICFHL